MGSVPLYGQRMAHFAGFRWLARGVGRLLGRWSDSPAGSSDDGFVPILPNAEADSTMLDRSTAGCPKKGSARFFLWQSTR